VDDLPEDHAVALTVTARSAARQRGQLRGRYPRSIAAVIRAATPEDARAIAEVQVRTWQAAYQGFLPAQLLDDMSVSLREDSWQTLLAGAERASLTVLAEDDDGAVEGFCTLVLPGRDEDATERTAEVAATYVVPPRWGQGVGKALLAHTLEELPGGEWDEAILWIFLRNAQGRAFYARSGFRLDGAKSVHEPSGVPTARMRLLFRSA
jgi:GNAT superfamily N-acetyltransferase